MQGIHRLCGRVIEHPLGRIRGTAQGINAALCEEGCTGEKQAEDQDR